MKTCSACNKSKPVAVFSKNSRTRDGLRSYCKDCQRASAARYRANNREKIAASKAEYRERNRERVVAAAAEYRRLNRESLSAQKKEYRAANPHVVWEHAYRYRARQFGFEPVVESFTRDALINRWGDACHHCGGPFEQLDHYPVPMFRGGEHSLENCRPSCARCNTSRNQYAQSLESVVVWQKNRTEF